jgi:hypothetical protein
MIRLKEVNIITNPEYYTKEMIDKLGLDVTSDVIIIDEESGEFARYGAIMNAEQAIIVHKLNEKMLAEYQFSVTKDGSDN